MQTIEMLKKRERVLALEIEQLLLAIKQQATDLASVIKQYFRIRQRHLWGAEEGSDRDRKRCKRFYKAWQSGDVVEAAVHGECTARIDQPTHTVEGAIARIAQLDYERRGLVQNIMWIEKSINKIEGCGPSLFLTAFEVLDPSVPVETSSVDYDFPGLDWQGKNPVIFNRAFYEVCSKFGLKRLRAAAQRDLKGPDGTCGADFGRILLRTYAQLLVDRFLITNPDPALVGTVSA